MSLSNNNLSKEDYVDNVHPASPTEQTNSLGTNKGKIDLDDDSFNSGSVGKISDEEKHNDQQREHVNSEEIYKKSWGKKIIRIAYFVLVLTAFCETFAGDSTSSFDSYATSNFESHSMISTVAVVYKITAIISYPIWAKVHDVVYRYQGFGIAFTFYTLAYVLYASCNTIGTYFAAELFYAVGLIGYRVFQQVFIAATSSLINRGLLSQFPDAIAAIPSLYIGSVIQDAFLDHSTWRWGYGVWAIIMAFFATILTTFMFWLDRTAKRHGEVKVRSSFEGMPEGSIFKKTYWYLFIKLDLFGGILLAAGCALFFIPFTLTGSQSPYRWHQPKLIAMIVVGFVLILSTGLWFRFAAKNPYVPYPVLTRKTIMICCALAAIDWCVNSGFSTYAKTVLQVAKGVSAGEAARIDNSKKVCLQIFSIVGGLLMKYTRRSKIFVLTGIPVTFLFHALLVYFYNSKGDIREKGLLYMCEVFIGASRGISQCALQVITQAIAGEENIAISTSFYLMFNSVGSLIGSCISGAIWNTVVLEKLREYLPADEKLNATKIYKNIKTALKYKKGTDERNAINRAYRETQQVIGWATVGILGVQLILMWFLDNVILTSHIDAYADEDSLVSVDEDPDMIKKTEKEHVAVISKPVTRSDKIKNFFGI